MKMSINVTKELASLERRTTRELRETYPEVFLEECRSHNRVWLIRRILWRMQANAEGDLSERARQRAAEIANDADLRFKAPPDRRRGTSPAPSAVVRTAAVKFLGDKRLPMPGTILTRSYK